MSAADDDARPNVLVCVTGSVAAIKAPLLVPAIAEYANVKFITTEHALTFYDLSDIAVPVYQDELEWDSWKKMGDDVLHIELRKWADVIVIAPLDANTLAKLANGLADNLLTCVARAWDFSDPFLVAPAMNTMMWDHPFTAKHLSILENELGFVIVPPVEKKLACGDFGVGAMASVDDIAAAVRDSLASKQLHNMFDEPSEPAATN